MVDEKEIFKGSENRLTLKQTYTHVFQCLYKGGVIGPDAPKMQALPKLG